MIKNILAIVLLMVVLNSSSAQNTPVPDYLTTQNFPDSVISLSLQALDSSSVTFQELLPKHKGKKVLVDIWASWCKDCIVGYPKLAELMGKADSSKVDFVFISVDKDEVKWRSAIERFGIKGEHYRSKTAWYNTLTNYIVLDWVPRYFVLDEGGKVILAKAISADHNDLRAIITE